MPTHGNKVQIFKLFLKNINFFDWIFAGAVMPPFGAGLLPPPFGFPLPNMVNNFNCLVFVYIMHILL